MGPINLVKYALNNYVEILAIFYIVLFAIIAIAYISYLLKKSIKEEELKKSKTSTQNIIELPQKYKVSINGSSILFNENGLNLKIIPALCLLAQKCDLYIITQISNDLQEHIIKQICIDYKIIPKLIQQHVFCGV